MKTDLTQIIGISAGTLTAVSMLPQLLKIIKEKEAEDISFFMLFILISGLVLWTIYGFMKEDIPIIVTNAFSILLNLVLLFFRLKYRKKK